MVQLTVMEMPHLSSAQALILHPPIFTAAFLGLCGSLCILTACLVKRERGLMINIQSEMVGRLVSWWFTIMWMHAKLVIT